MTDYCKNKKITKKIYTAGVIVEKDLSETKDAVELVSNGILDCLQLHGYEISREFSQNYELSQLPHYCCVNINSESDLEKLDNLNKLGECRILIDAQSNDKIGGTGKQIDDKLLKMISQKYKLWLAGGLNAENVRAIIEKYSPEFLDLSSSIEIKPGIKDNIKIEEFFNALKY
jgi:phosphoribosylanthranilate isomerase